MNNPLTSPYTSKLQKATSLGLIVLGLSFIAWAIMGIWAPLQYAENGVSRYHAFPTAFAAELDRLRGDGQISLMNNESPDIDLPALGDEIGNLTIPVFDKSYPIVQGTEDAQLAIGVGHVVQSVLPGEYDNCVLSGHRDTFFSSLDKLRMGDQLIVETQNGVFVYAVSGARIVEADDRTVIVPTDSAVLTLTTCYPFNYIGSAPYRYIISADLI